MNVFILGCIGFINIITIFGIYQGLHEVEKKKRIGFLAIGFGGMYLIVSGIYLLSSIGIEQKELLGQTKQLLTFTFVPVNSIISLIFLARSYSKLLAKQIKLEKFKKICIIIAIILLVAFIFEYFYFKSVNQSILDIALQAKGE